MRVRAGYGRFTKQHVWEYIAALAVAIVGICPATPLPKNASGARTQRRCVVCDRKTTRTCTLCQVPLCVNDRSCWADFHHPAYAGRPLDQNQQTKQQ